MLGLRVSQYSRTCSVVTITRGDSPFLCHRARRKIFQKEFPRWRRRIVAKKSHDTTTRARHPVHMSSDVAHTAMTDAGGDITTATTPASLAEVQDAIPGLPDHLVVTHVLRAEYFDDPAELARLRVVSRTMRDTVSATGLRFEEMDENEAVELGCLSVLRRLQRQGRLSHQEYLCAAAARSGQLEELKVLRADGTPWDKLTCWAAASGGHLEVLLWAKANGCPRDEMELHIATESGHEAVVRALIKADADVNKAADDSVTPLIFAAQKGHEVTVRALIKAGADVNKAIDDGTTPLYIAAREGHEASVRTMIEADADVNKAVDEDVTPLFIATEKEYAAIVQIIRDAGAV